VTIGRDWQGKVLQTLDNPLIFLYDAFFEAGPAMARGMTDEVLTTAETCRYLKVAPRTLYRYIKEKRVPAFKLGKDWRFVKSELDQLMRRKSREHARR